MGLSLSSLHFELYHMDFCLSRVFFKNLDFFSLALRLAFHCSVDQFLILIIAAISEMSSKFFPNSKKNQKKISGN